MFGIKPKLFALALERPVYETSPWTIGLRGYGQTGTVEGAYTCPSSVLPFAPGSPNNSYGCQAESSDTATLRFVGGEVSVSYSPPGALTLSPHVALAVNYMDVGFQVNALTFNYLDRTHLLSHGVTWAGTAGVSYRLSERLGVAVDLFYTPLSVRRPSSAPLQNDGLFNLRALLEYRLR